MSSASNDVAKNQAACEQQIVLIRNKPNTFYSMSFYRNPNPSKT